MTFPDLPQTERMNLVSLFMLATLLIPASGPVHAAEHRDLHRIGHIVVIYLENHSFDSLFGWFPGANGIAKAGAAAVQVDEYGRPYRYLPAVVDGKQPDSRFPDNLPNRPFDIADYVPADARHPDPTHRFFIHQMQINGGRNDRFAALSASGGLTMGYYRLPNSALWQYAREFTLADNFFQAAFGGSFLNHQWLICACTPQFPDAPQTLRQWRFDTETGKPVSDPTVTADGYAVGTIQPFYPPFDDRFAEHRLPPQYQTTIGDRLSEKSISWAWYAGGWDDALAGNTAAGNFQFHHQPFVYYANYAPGTAGRQNHLKDRARLLEDLQGDFPQVAFYKPVGSRNQHPGYSSTAEGDEEVREIIEAIRHSPIWPDTAIIVTYDEHGGFWDHAAPPEIDRWGPGTRIPAVIVSPWAKKGYIDHTRYDTTSILRFIETRFDLAPLTERDVGTNSLGNAFDFGQKPYSSRQVSR